MISHWNISINVSFKNIIGSKTYCAGSLCLFPVTSKGIEMNQTRNTRRLSVSVEKFLH